MVDAPKPVTRPSDRSTAPPSSPTMPLTKVRSPSGSTPHVGTVMVRGSPAVTLAEKLRADGGWFGLHGVGQRLDGDGDPAGHGPGAQALG